MPTMALVERSTTLDADPGSVRAARRFVVEALAASGQSDDIDTVELLVSELVTNAILHARTPVELLVRVEREWLRVEVRDASRALPSARAHDRESQTGRGLELVELLSDRWGAALDDDGAASGGEGKSVWFELELDRPAPTTSGHESRTDHAAASSGRSGPRSQVCLEGVPVAMFRASQEHRDGLTREFVLMTLDDGHVSALPARLVALSEGLARRFAGETAALHAQVDEAEQRGDLTVDLIMDLPPDAVDAIAEVVALLEEADRYCAAGALLTLAASDEVRSFRRWCEAEIRSQLGGGPPRQWRQG